MDSARKSVFQIVNLVGKKAVNPAMRVKVHFDYLSTTWILAKLKGDLKGIVQPK